MKTGRYILKLSPQGQLTLPKELRQRLRIQAGSKVVVKVSRGGEAMVGGDLPITARFGKYPGLVTGGGDAVETVRKLRNAAAMQAGVPAAKYPTRSSDAA